ncbi:MAG: hypothetical protein QXU18_12250 [Thermoplasmatales archaeon]
MVTFRTTLSYSKKGKGSSLRTTVPHEIVLLLELKDGDILIWDYDKKTMSVTVKGDNKKS